MGSQLKVTFSNFITMFTVHKWLCFNKLAILLAHTVTHPVEDQERGRGGSRQHKKDTLIGR